MYITKILNKKLFYLDFRFQIKIKINKNKLWKIN